jgi:hypothetical protein
MFFGTPHRGSNIAYWASIVVSIGRVAFPMRFKGTYLRALKENSELLREISENFLSIAPRFRIISFFEELNHPLLGGVVCSILFTHIARDTNRPIYISTYLS